MNLTDDEVRIIKEWFCVVNSMYPTYFSESDYKLASKIYERLHLTVPSAIIENLTEGDDEL